MTIVSSKQDPDALTFVVVAEFAARRRGCGRSGPTPGSSSAGGARPPGRRPSSEHDVVAGGGSRYYMTGPDGEKARGWWRFLSLDEPRHLEFEDGFSDESGLPNPQMPTIRGRVELEEIAAGTG